MRHVLLCSLLVVAACAKEGQQDLDRSGGSESAPELRAAENVALTGDGIELAGDLAERAPVYQLTATIDPATGRVEGTLRADLPSGSAEAVTLRFFPALVDPEANVSDVTVGGASADHKLDTSLLTVKVGDAGAADGSRVELGASFSYQIPELPSAGLDDMLGGGDNLQPADIGLLARSDQVVTLGHWYPVWIPDGLRAEPAVDGFGDISNFPAAIVEAEVTEPAGWTLATGGVRADQDGERVLEAGYGLRDLAMVLLEEPATADVATGETTVNALAADDTGTLAEVADETVGSLEALSEAFGPYPWEELDVVATPLGSGVGGMEFPGMIWIEASIFAGGLPGFGDSGLGDLGDLGDLEDLEDLGDLEDILGEDLGDLEDLEGLEDMDDILQDLEDILGEDLGDLEHSLDDNDQAGGEGEGKPNQLDLGDLGLGGLLDPDVLGSTRAWVVAHEVGHQWWHALVGNDSMTAPVVDEPLAQYSSCVVFREEWPDIAEKVCEAQTAGSYQQARTLGAEDAPADQPTDEFDSSRQYGGVVYGKAPVLYQELADEFGEDAVQEALAGFVAQHAFEQASSDDLRSALGEGLGDPATVDDLWSRWIEGVHGDEDLLGDTSAG